MSLPGQRELRTFILNEGPAELTRHWRSKRSASRGGWLSWVRREGTARFPRLAFKLYLSPPPTMVRDALRELVPELTESACVRFKIGFTPADLARPDKLVAYFPDRSEALRVGEAVAGRLGGMPAHGVPFSCAVDDGGLLSWGLDPPHDPDEPVSWRTWLCSELAHAIVDGRPGDPLQAAGRRLATVGVDPVSWEPSYGLWESDGTD